MHRPLSSTLRCSVAVLTMFAFVGCQSDTLPTSTNSPPSSTIESAVQGLGYDPSGLIDRGSEVIVEGDILLPKAALLRTGGFQPRAARSEASSADSSDRRVPRGPLYQWSTNIVVKSTYVPQIKVDMSSVDPNWQTALRAAMNDWNAIRPGVAVHFVEGAPGDIVASMVNLGGSCSSGAVGAGAPPTSSGHPGPTLYISPVWTYCLTASQREYAMVHELGHTLGLRHTDWQAGGEPINYGATQGANLIAGTPATDASSVMNRGTVPMNFTGFSTYDKQAAFSLYRILATGFADTYPGGTPLVSWNPYQYADHFELEYIQSGEMCTGDYTQPCTPFSYTEYVGYAPPSGTSITDPYRSYTGIDRCSTWDGSYTDSNYKVSVVFPDGQRDVAYVAARVQSC